MKREKNYLLWSLPLLAVNRPSSSLFQRVHEVTVMRPADDMTLESVCAALEEIASIYPAIVDHYRQKGEVFLCYSRFVRDLLKQRNFKVMTCGIQTIYHAWAEAA